MDIAVELRSVGYAYETGPFAVEGISLQIARGEVVGVLGATGAGKTTLLEMVACRRLPTVGTLTVEGIDAGVDPASAATRIAAVFGSGDSGTSAPPKRPILVVDDADRLEVEVRGLLASTQPVTALLATCDAEFVRRTCQRVAVLVRGKLVTDAMVGPTPSLTGAAYYDIVVSGRLEGRRAAYFDGFDVRSGEGTTVISGRVEDQAALHGLLERIRDLGLPLVSVRPSLPDLEGLMRNYTR